MMRMAWNRGWLLWVLGAGLMVTALFIVAQNWPPPLRDRLETAIENNATNEQAFSLAIEGATDEDYRTRGRAYLLLGRFYREGTASQRQRAQSALVWARAHDKQLGEVAGRKVQR